MSKSVFTTFEVGDLCQVYHTTVINWINKGQLKAYKTPGKHRRILKEDLLRFMRQFGIHIPRELSEQKRKVLAVDDDPAMLKLLRKTFSSQAETIELQITDSGVEALVQVGREAPDLVILDVIMPGMDGIQVCEALRSNPKTAGIKIIAITGKKLAGPQDRFLRKNIDEIFSKPFSPSKLLETSLRLLGIDTKAVR